jgi:uncharacterized YccA/Bax inhibitor family protein
MSNPVLNRVSETARTGRGFAAMDPDRPVSNNETAGVTPGAAAAGTVSIEGVVVKTAGLGALGGLAAMFGWQNPGLAGLVIPAVLVSLVLSLVTMFKPFAAKVTAPVYAVAQGFVLGILSVSLNAAYPGIARDALGISGATFAVLLFAYSRRWVTVTARMRSAVTVATLGIAVYYLVNLGTSLLLGTSLPLIWDNSAAGIAFSLAVAGLAAWNFLLDFDIIERSATEGADRRYEWALAFGVAVTFAWLYLELLRLLSKLRSR